MQIPTLLARGSTRIVAREVRRLNCCGLSVLFLNTIHDRNVGHRRRTARRLRQMR